MKDLQKKMMSNRIEKKINRRYDRYDKKKEKAEANGDESVAKVEKKFGYDYDAADKAGIKPDETGHWASRDPKTGEILKAKRHPSMPRTKIGEKMMGYRLYRKGGKLYSKPKKGSKNE